MSVLAGRIPSNTTERPEPCLQSTEARVGAALHRRWLTHRLLPYKPLGFAYFPWSIDFAASVRHGGSRTHNLTHKTAGAYGATISGAGPTAVAIVDDRVVGEKVRYGLF
jgi:hypothetical protein